MSLKSSLATNQEPTQERGTGPRPSPIVKIDYSSPLETQAQERDLNPGPGSLQATGPMDCWATRIFWGLNPCKLRLL
ncbi:hypothetical protein DSO57_1002717 [Entomophthora muscae]|uniref:Uncharacterized protein n=1 Tax=Entomophthora muscae TaxID=34485 RepID=A0ACC2UUQ5_9FUNG|nr:hypothetical protein DSO57_1002717 [Entomophthora muscae]